METAGISSIGELRRLPADELLKAAAAHVKKSSIAFRTVIDGRFLPKEPLLAQISFTDFNDTPILAGYNAD